MKRYRITRNKNMAKFDPWPWDIWCAECGYLPSRSCHRDAIWEMQHHEHLHHEQKRQALINIARATETLLPSHEVLLRAYAREADNERS